MQHNTFYFCKKNLHDPLSESLNSILLSYNRQIELLKKSLTITEMTRFFTSHYNYSKTKRWLILSIFGHKFYWWEHSPWSWINNHNPLSLSQTKYFNHHWWPGSFLHLKHFGKIAIFVSVNVFHLHEIMCINYGVKYWVSENRAIAWWKLQIMHFYARKNNNISKRGLQAF